MAERLTRIGIFYDGNFFNVVSNYYAYHHAVHARISINGLHEFLRKRIAHEEQVDPRLCQVVDVHYFRGRFTANETDEAGKLLAERQFDDVLVREGVTTHYLPMGSAGTEKGIDVWFALEAYELAIYKRFDVCVLVACDSDYLPLARKLNTLGTRVMVVGWDFEFEDASGRKRTTRTSAALLDEVTYPILLSSMIEDKTQKDAIKEIFLPRKEPGQTARAQAAPSTTTPTAAQPSIQPRASGRIQNLIVRDAEDKRFGFITPDSEGDNIWFGERDVEGTDFMSLQRGQQVTYVVGENFQGICARSVRPA